MAANVVHGDSLIELAKLDANSVDAVVTDPPYGLAFMGKRWDYDVPSVELWREVFRVMKPGAHLLSFGGTRTYHRMVVAIEDAGFEIRDMVSWNYGQGFPKSLNVNKICSKMGLVCECKEIPQHSLRPMLNSDLPQAVQFKETSGQVLQSGVPEQGTQGPMLWAEPKKGPASRKKPSMEGRGNLQADKGKLHRPEVREVPEGVSGYVPQGRLRNGASTSDCEINRADFVEDRSSTPHGSQHKKQSPEKSGTMADERESQVGGAWKRCSRCGKSILPEGLGSALKPALEPIVLARKPLEKGLTVAQNVLKWGTGAINVDAGRIGFQSDKDKAKVLDPVDGSKGYEHHAGAMTGGIARMDAGSPLGRFPANVLLDEEAAAQLGEPSRFFYVAKTSKRERNAGLEGMALKAQGAYGEFAGDGRGRQTEHQPTANHHPTVKPIKLMEYLCKLITPPGGIILDPFLGSGSTGCAAVKLGYKFIGIEREAEYVEIARRRIEHHGRSS